MAILRTSLSALSIDVAMSTTSSYSSTAGTVYSARLDLFPCEQPTYKQAKQWLEKAEDDLTQGQFGPALRGQIPQQLCHLTFKRDEGITPLSDEARAAAGPMELARYDQTVAKAKLDEQVRLKQLETGMIEYTNKLAALLAAALRPNAGLRLKKMLKTHAIASEPGTYDGMAMWKELSALTEATSSIAERRENDRIVEAARDTMLPDGCSAQEYADKVKLIVRDHNPYSERPYEGQALGHYIIGLMPRANAHDKRTLTAELIKANKLDDMEEVIARCTEVVRDSATTTTPIAATTPMQQLQAALALVGDDASVIANLTAGFKGGKGGKGGKTAAGFKQQGKDKQANKFRLPEGQTCPEGTCNLNHAAFAPGSKCFRSPHFKGPLDKAYRNNAKHCLLYTSPSPRD